jgi:ribonuclease HI
VVKCISKLGLVEPVAAETMAVFYGVSNCRDQGFQSLIVEGDAKQVVDAIQLRGWDASNFGQLVDDVLVIVDSFFNWQIQLVNQEANRAAHVLAQVAIQQVIDTVWIEEIPPCIYR